MSNQNRTLNDIAWENLFARYNILHQVEANGHFQISAHQIKEEREPRLMAKFDHTVNLPKIFSQNKLAILPVTRGDYIISHFDAYHKFEPASSPVTKVTVPPHIQSLVSENLTSEAIALNCAVASGIVADFLEDDGLVSTVSGRMSSGSFSFNIDKLNGNSTHTVSVSNSQIEIDAAYEGFHSLALFEAKRDLADDFLVRQLYYPFRAWQNKVTKPVRPLFLVYTNGIYHIYEYQFEDANNYSSISLIRQRNYSIEDTEISAADIEQILHAAQCVSEPALPFPQADSFKRVINLCELLNGQDLSRDDITERYAFDARQTNYYTDAVRYLGLVEKTAGQTGSPAFRLTEKGKQIMRLNYRQRQLALCSCILSHKVFSESLKLYFNRGEIPTTREIVKIMKECAIYNVNSESTYERRSSTVKGWLNWIVALTST
ncbi:MAG: transcriptional regulator [Oscillospiraceae bacterium]|nr:transcriptional regulator [Oscillospiraceae bacterium]